MDFQELIRRHGEKAYNFAYRLAGNEQDARDLVQEAFARALEHQERYDESRPFDAWLNRILHNVYLDGIRRHANRRTVSLDAPSPAQEAQWDEVLEGTDVDPQNLMARREEDAMIQKALDELPVAYKTALLLCDVEGLSYERIAEIMACPVGTVRSRIHQGRVLMRRALEGFEGHGGTLQ